MQGTAEINYQVQNPDEPLTDFVKCIWHIRNCTPEKRIVTILPDGYFDIIFSSINNQPFQCFLFGLVTKPMTYTIPINSAVFAVSFKLLAAEYILKTDISTLVDKGKRLFDNSWNMNSFNFSEFHDFVNMVTHEMITNLDKEIDPRKQALFNTIYDSNGSITVEQISTSNYWSSRQINRYFKSRFGISLKTYCNILRFRASFAQLNDGRLFPEQSYFDQSHFIKEVKRFSDASPKQLAKNKNDRFIQLSTLPKK